MNFYKVLYIKLYQFTLKTPSGDYNPEQIASMVLTLFIAMNTAVLALILLQFNVKISAVFFESYTPMIFVFVGTALLNYFTFIQKEKYSLLIKTYDKKGKSKKQLDTVFSIFYFIVSIVLLMILI